MLCDILLKNVSVLDRQGQTQKEQSIAIHNGFISWIGHINDLPEEISKDAQDVKECNGNLVTPGLIDCHTHLVYAGHRSNEYQLRLRGASYAEIAVAGGGILSTVKYTREASEEQLLKQSLPRIQAMKNQGVTTVEIKSGYGLDIKNELKMLKVAKLLGQMTGLRIKTTFLGAHAVPLEYKDKTQQYVDMLCQEMLPEIVESKLADFVDVFCENIAFSLKQTEQIFQVANRLGLRLKCHAGQLSDLGAASLSAEYGALSCDHLEYIDPISAKAMADAGTIAVLLPGAWYFLKETKKPPVELLREFGVGMAVATDCNPGSSPTTSLLLMMNMACQFFGLTIPEALSAVTWQAAKALGIDHETGSLQVRKTADLIYWSLSESEPLCYYFGYPIPRKIMMAGKWVQPEEILF